MVESVLVRAEHTMINDGHPEQLEGLVVDGLPAVAGPFG
jgi:hypothetical protein